MSDDKIQQKVQTRIQHLRRSHDVKAWEKFREWIEGDTERICKNINTRWMVSILDTYADYGTEHERACALIGVSFTNTVKLSCTLYGDKAKMSGGSLWDGMTPFSPGPNGNMIQNLFRRIARTMKGCPTIKYIFGEILVRMFRNEVTMMAKLASLCANPVRKDTLDPFGRGPKK